MSSPCFLCIFRSVIRELEQRLGQVVVAAFDDAANMTATFKLLDSFEGLLEREAIAAELERKHFQLLVSYGDELATVSDIFANGKDAPTMSQVTLSPLLHAACLLFSLK